MNRVVISLCLLLLIVLAHTQPGNDERAYMNAYAEADHLYYKSGASSSFPGNNGKVTEKEIAMKRQALAGFKNILPAIEKVHDDSLAFYCYYKVAVLEHSFDSLGNAMLFYEKAITLRRDTQQGTNSSLQAKQSLQDKRPSSRGARQPLRETKQQDSLLFRPYLLSGTIEYNSNQFDPAFISFKKAEAIAEQYAIAPDDAYRLYHTLGTLNYETANYDQAIHYFQRASGSISKTGSLHDTLLIHCQMKIITALTKLERFDEANRISKELLKQDTTRNDVLQSAGTVNLLLGNGPVALNYFSRVHYTDRRQVKILTQIGKAWESAGHTDSARYYYLEAIKENNKWPGKDPEAGSAFKYLADFDREAKSFNVALKKYQDALMQFVPDFNESDVYKNPEQFSGAFNYTELLNTLLAKAKTFEKFYLRVSDSRKMEAALQAYKAAFRLANYVARTYNGDDARIFLNNIKDTIRNHTLEQSLLLYEQTNQPSFLEEAYRFDQLNKASVFSNSMGKDEAGNGDSSLLDKESSLRTTITRLSMKAAESNDSESRKALTQSIQDNELSLRKIQDALTMDPGYAAKHAADNIPPVSQIQQTLDRNTAVVSFHVSENGLLAFIITYHKFEFVRSPIEPDFMAALDSFRNSLHDISSGQNHAAALSERLYTTLIDPLRSVLANSTRLVIIADNELAGLPFEALQNKNGKYLIEQYAVQYQYSTVLFNQQAVALETDMQDSHPDSSRIVVHNAYNGQMTKGVSITSQPGVITSLWKADTKTTDYITRRLNYYLKRGLSQDKALQRAKTDLLGNAEIDTRFKSPGYWAHLVCTGQYQPSPSLSLWWPLGSSVGVSFLIIFLANMHTRRSRLRIHDLY